MKLLTLEIATCRVHIGTSRAQSNVEKVAFGVDPDNTIREYQVNIEGLFKSVKSSTNFIYLQFWLTNYPELNVTKFVIVTSACQSGSYQFWIVKFTTSILPILDCEMNIDILPIKIDFKNKIRISSRRFSKLYCSSTRCWCGQSLPNIWECGLPCTNLNPKLDIHTYTYLAQLIWVHCTGPLQSLKRNFLKNTWKWS